MLTELTLGEYLLYTNVIREAKDAYTARKVQKDKKKLKTWINALLEDRDLIIFHKENGIEKMSVVTRKTNNVVFADAPLSWETVGYQTYLVLDYVLGYELPSTMAIAIHANDITKFMCKAEGVQEISRTVQWYSYGHY
jgi:hypothetical protein